MVLWTGEVSLPSEGFRYGVSRSGSPVSGSIPISNAASLVCGGGAMRIGT